MVCRPWRAACGSARRRRGSDSHPLPSRVPRFRLLEHGGSGLPENGGATLKLGLFGVLVRDLSGWGLTGWGLTGGVLAGWVLAGCGRHPGERRREWVTRSPRCSA